MGVESSYSDELPEAIIHHVQSLLNHRDSARTTLLSKSWRRAWSTRPTLHLTESHFPLHRDDSTPFDPLSELATNTFRRYEESNLRIDTFELCLSMPSYSRSGLSTEWSLKALRMGATHITFRSSKRYRDRVYFPVDKVFGSENIVSLRLESVSIFRLPVIKCSGLKSLTLGHSSIPSTSVLCTILSCCPLIQNISLSDDLYSEAVQPNAMIRLHKLTSLLLCRVRSELETLFLDDLSSKFPNLKQLTLTFCSEKKIRIISSRSLEILNIKVDKYFLDEPDVSFEFDVPNIRKFTFESSYMPKLTFMSTSCDQFESHISVEHCGEPNTKWLCELSKFLSQLRGSKIHLCLHVRYGDSFDYQPGEIKGILNVCEVEDLTMDTKGLSSIVFDALLDGLFRMCRPMMITQYASPPKDDDDDDDIDEEDEYDSSRHDDPENTVDNDISLFQALEQGVKVRSFLTSQFMYGLRDLEGVNAQELSDGVWMPQPFDSLLDSLLQYDNSVTSEQRKRFRFQLKWKSRN